MFAFRAALVVAVLTTAAPLPAQSNDSLALSWERFELPNGLEVVLLPDSTRDEVAVELWTHVGSRHEPVGKFGLAHFFEHALPHGVLMRTGAVVAMADSLRRGSNARTRLDYTRYYQQSTREGAGLFLLMAATRLSSDPEIDLTERRVESQRERVLVEMERWVNHRWGQPVGAALRRGTFGVDHPYGRVGYGTPEETHATTRDDLVRWQRANVRPEYTTLFVAGGFDPSVIRAYVELVFGRIPGGRRPPREAPRVPAASGGRHSMQIAADSSLLYLAWPTPEWAHADAPLLSLFAHALEARIVRDAPAGVGNVLVGADASELAGEFTVMISHAPDVGVDALESWARSAVGEAVDGLSDGELAAARSAERERVAAGHEELGWIGGRIELVGESIVFADDPDHYVARLERQAAVGSRDVARVARQWLGAPAFVLRVEGTGAESE